MRDFAYGWDRVTREPPSFTRLERKGTRSRVPIRILILKTVILSEVARAHARATQSKDLRLGVLTVILSASLEREGPRRIMPATTVRSFLPRKPLFFGGSVGLQPLE